MNDNNFYLDNANHVLALCCLLIATITAIPAVAFPIISMKTGIDLFLPWGISTLGSIVCLFGFIVFVYKSREEAMEDEGKDNQLSERI